MNQIIIYQQENGTPAVVMPTDEAIRKIGIMAVAINDVPKGKRFKIIDADQLPQDWPQEAWTVDEAELTDGIGGSNNEHH